MNICISSGHGKYIRGAAGKPVPPQLDEVNEARRVVETVAAELRQRGVNVKTFHDDTSRDQNTNLKTITKWHNSQGRDLDISVHFNAFDHTAHGTEVLYVTQGTLAAQVSSAIAKAGGFKDRGAKYNGDLYVLNNTTEPAILIEVCFCDNTSDSDKYRAHYGEICEAIATAIAPEAAVIAPPVEAKPPPVEIKPPPIEAKPPVARVELTIKTTGNVVVSINGQDLVVEPPSLYAANHTGITCTIFGGTGDPNYSAYDEHFITDTELGCALPYKWRDTPPPRVHVYNPGNNKHVVCAIVDVGPWNTDDEAYVLGDARPQAESGVDKKGRTTNNAGIDLTPAAAAAIGLEGKGLVHWFAVPEAAA